MDFHKNCLMIFLASFIFGKLGECLDIVVEEGQPVVLPCVVSASIPQFLWKRFDDVLITGPPNIILRSGLSIISNTGNQKDLRISSPSVSSSGYYTCSSGTGTVFSEYQLEVRPTTVTEAITTEEVTMTAMIRQTTNEDDSSSTETTNTESGDRNAAVHVRVMKPQILVLLLAVASCTSFRLS